MVCHKLGLMYIVAVQPEEVAPSVERGAMVDCKFRRSLCVKL